MSEVLLPMVEGEWKKPPACGDRSLMTPLAVVEGEILIYLEGEGTTSLRKLIRDLEWPASMTMMAVGGLVREQLVRAIQHDLGVILELQRESAIPQWADPEGV